MSTGRKKIDPRFFSTGTTPRANLERSHSSADSGEREPNEFVLIQAVQQASNSLAAALYSSAWAESPAERTSLERQNLNKPGCEKSPREITSTKRSNVSSVGARDLSTVVSSPSRQAETYRGALSGQSARVKARLATNASSKYELGPIEQFYMSKICKTRLSDTEFVTAATSLSPLLSNPLFILKAWADNKKLNKMLSTIDGVIERSGRKKAAGFQAIHDDYKTLKDKFLHYLESRNLCLGYVGSFCSSDEARLGELFIDEAKAFINQHSQQSTPTPYLELLTQAQAAGEQKRQETDQGTRLQSLPEHLSSNSFQKGTQQSPDDSFLPASLKKKDGKDPKKSGKKKFTKAQMARAKKEKKKKASQAPTPPDSPATPSPAP